MARIAVIGAGMAGAACARGLSERRHAVTVFDKGRSVGGRMAQRRVDGFVYDHGAQYLSARDPGFIAAVSRWEAAGLVAPWPEVTSGAGDPVWIGVPAMNAPIKAMLDGIEVRTGARVVTLTREGGWWLGDQDGGRHGSFDKVAVTIPAPQAVELVGTVACRGTLDRLRDVVFAPCWACLFTSERPLPIELTGRVEHDVFAWAADNSSKRGRGDSDSWTLHATPNWSTAHLERPPEEVAQLMIDAFREITGGEGRDILHLTAHRWRFSMATAPLGGPCLVDGDLGFAGDWCFGLRVEAAWLSGTALANGLG